MFRNYLKIAFRTLARNRVFSLINILGLGLGITCSLFIYMWVRDELSYDRFHENKNLLYKVFVNAKDKDGSIVATFDATPGKLADAFKAQIPEIERAVTVLGAYDHTFMIGDKVTKENGGFCSPDLFQMFSFHMLQGDPASVLSSADRIVISEKLAIKYFGKDEALGKVIRVDDRKDYIVSGVMSDIPQNSSIKFDFMLPIKEAFDENPWMIMGWGNFGPQTYVMLKPNAVPGKVNDKIRDFLTQQDKTVNDKVLSIQSMERVYLYSEFANGVATGGRIDNVNHFSIIAAFILLIACINFMNLATARSIKRGREVGVRKVIGAGRGSLFGQFIGEAVLMALMAVVISILLIFVFLPMFNSITGKKLSIHLGDPAFDSVLLGVALITGIIAGSYPALFLSSLRPVLVLKNAFTFTSGATLFRKGLVIFQFILSIALIICSVIIYQQMHYIQTKNLGLDRDNVIYSPLESELAKNYEPFKSDVLQTGYFDAVTKGSGIPTNVGMHTESVGWQGKDPNEKVGFWEMSVNLGYIKAMKIQLIKGRDYDLSFGADSLNFLINEEAAKVMHLKDPVGQTVTYQGKNGIIIGLMKNFNFHSLHETIAPLFVHFQPESYPGVLIMRISAGKTKNAMAALEGVWKKYSPRSPFNYIFADDLLKQQYQSETMIEKLSKVFTSLAIFISCMGLFGLAMFIAEQKRKEISIRKVLGANVAMIVSMLSVNFLKLIVIATVVAFPISWWAMNKWLGNFVYRVGISWWVFLFSGLAAVSIALITISFHALKAAFETPLKSLRSE